MATKKSGKAFEIISTNPKMDTSGMAGKPMDYSMMLEKYTPPPMTLEQMMEERERKTSKKPEPEHG